jgi:anti-sigma factor ChrR (cupin superfamily)
MMNKLMLSCRRAAELIDRRAHVKLHPVEKIQLFVHTRMCDACRNYIKQSRIIDSIFTHQAERQNNLPGHQATLSPEIKSRIIKKLEEN